MVLVTNEQMAYMLQDAETEIKYGLEKVYRRKGIEEGMRQIHRGIGSIQTIRKLIRNQSTVETNIKVQK
jgi:hypothetical protein